jgi:hypothetical protein
MKSFYGVLVVGLLFGSGSLLAEESAATPAQGFSPCMGQGPGPGMRPGYGRSMMPGMTPELRQRHWEQMRQRGYGPGMGQGYGRGMMYGMPPANN